MGSHFTYLYADRYRPNFATITELVLTTVSPVVTLLKTNYVHFFYKHHNWFCCTWFLSYAPIIAGRWGHFLKSLCSVAVKRTLTTICATAAAENYLSKMEFAMQEKEIAPVLTDLQQRLPWLCAFCFAQCLLIFFHEPEAIWLTLKSHKLAAGSHDNVPM